MDQRELLARAGLRAGEGVADDAPDTVGRVDGDLGGDLVLGALADGAAVAGVRALGALADDDEVDLRLAGERGGDPGSSLDGRRLTWWSKAKRSLSRKPRSRTPDGTDGSPIAPSRMASCALEGVEVGVGEGLTGGVVAPGAEVELLGLQLHILRKDGGEDLETFGHDLLAGCRHRESLRD